jgi:hypothetical protein
MMKRTQQLAALALLAVPSLVSPNFAFTQKHINQSGEYVPSYVLQCHGVTSASTSLKQDGPKASTDKSTDELWITRYGRLLKVQVNAKMYRAMDRNTREILQKPDPYKITAETGEGFVAVFVNGSTTLHTLTIDKSLTYGIWTESGFSFLEHQSEPISETVSLTCTQEKQ